MKNLSFHFILICAGCLRLVAQEGFPPLDLNHQPRLCSLLNPRINQTNPIDDVALLNAYNRQTHLIRSLRLVAVVRGKAGAAKPREIPADIDFVQPDLIRVTGLAPLMGSRGFEMASDGRELRLLVPERGKKTFFVGSLDAPAQSQNAGENLRPQPLINAVRWQEGKLIAGARLQGARDSDLRELTVDLPHGLTGAHTAKIDFDLRHGQVDSITAYDLAGQMVSRANYSDWQEVASSASSPSQGCLPRRIEFVQPKEDFEISLQIYQIALNTEIPRSYFRPFPPRGIPVVPLVVPR